MEKKTIDKVAKQVYRQFPEVSGSRPKVSAQGSEKYLLIFKGKGKGPQGKSIPRQVRVVTEASGKILKITTSR